MPRKKDVAMKIPFNQENSVENAYKNKGKCATSVKEKKQCAPGSRRKGKDITSLTTSEPCHFSEEILPHVVSSSRNRKRNSITTKLQRDTNKKSLTDKNMENKDSEKKKKSAPRSKKKENERSLAKVVTNIQSIKEISSPDVLFSKKPKRKNGKKGITKSPCNESNKKILSESNKNENIAKDKICVKKKKECMSRSRKKIKEDDTLPTIVNHLNFGKKITSPVVSVSVKPRKKTITPKKLYSGKRGAPINVNSTNKSDKNDICPFEENPCIAKFVRNKISVLTSVDSPFLFVASPSVSSIQQRNNITGKKIASSSILPETKKRSGNSGKKKNTCVQKFGKKSKVELTSENLLTFNCFSATNSTSRSITNKSQPNSRKRKLSIVQENLEEKLKSIGFKKRKRRLQPGDKKVIKELIEELVDTSAQNVLPCIAQIKTPAAVSSLNSQSTFQEIHETRSINSSTAGSEVSVSSTACVSVPNADPLISESVSSLDQAIDFNGFRETRCVDSQSADTETFVSSIEDLPIYSEKESTSTQATASAVNLISDNEGVQEIKCMICFDLETFTDFETISCNHNFHSSCLRMWYQVQKICPVCTPEVFFSNDSIEAFKDVKTFANINNVTKEVNGFQNADKNTETAIDTQEFLPRCVICKEPSIFFEFNYKNDRYPDFKCMPCGHNVHISCAYIFIDTCPVCVTNTNIEDDGFYEFPEEIRCVICLDTGEYSDFEYIYCCHSFHSQCIKTWFRMRRDEICPVCMTNNNINAIQNESVYGFLEDIKCAICMDIEESSEFTRLSCGHNVHTNCTQTTFDEKTYCPTCMKNVPIKTDEDDVRCVICVDTEENKDFEFLPCAHSFHVVCIQSWLRNGKSCPTCNTPILNIPNMAENIGYACI